VIDDHFDGSEKSTGTRIFLNEIMASLCSNSDRSLCKTKSGHGDDRSRPATPADPIERHDPSGTHCEQPCFTPIHNTPAAPYFAFGLPNICCSSNEVHANQFAVCGGDTSAAPAQNRPIADKVMSK